MTPQNQQYESVSLFPCSGCGKVTYSFKGWQRNGTVAAMECQHCGQMCRVENMDVSTAMVDKGALKRAAQMKINRAAKTPIKKNTNKVGGTTDHWHTMNFRVTTEQRTVIRATFEAVREFMGVKGKKWRGTILENICMNMIATLPNHNVGRGFSITDTVENKQPGESMTTFITRAEVYADEEQSAEGADE